MAASSTAQADGARGCPRHHQSHAAGGPPQRLNEPAQRIQAPSAARAPAC